MAEVNPNSKQQRAIKLVLAGKQAGKSRKILIQEIREVCGMSDAGAATYYQNAVSKLREKGLLVKTTVVVADVVTDAGRSAMDMTLLANSNTQVDPTPSEEPAADLDETVDAPVSAE